MDDGFLVLSGGHLQQKLSPRLSSPKRYFAFDFDFHVLSISDGSYPGRYLFPRMLF
jgi:hypothetical protein